MPPAIPPRPLQVLIAGAGVAGLETMMALRGLAGPRVAITLVAPNPEFTYRPLAVAEPFGVDQVRSYPLERIASDFDATFVQDEVSWVGVRGECVFLQGGDEMGYDALVMALGARPRRAWPHVPTFRGPRDVEMMRRLVDDVERGDVGSLAFVVPSGTTWAFPLYELALLTASRVKEAGVDVELVMMTPEREPLAVFGRSASAEVSDLLAAAGVRFQGGKSVEVTPENALFLNGVETPLRFDRVLAVPRLEGPAPRGLPCDDDGFIPIDPHGLVLNAEHVYAAGDGTDFPVKQGGIATQQADAVAEVIAKRAGARVYPRPLRPVLRGYLLANGSSRYLRGELDQRDGGTSQASESTLWWPADKIAGTYLAPYLAAVDADTKLPVTVTAPAGEHPVPITSWVEESPFGE
ncbi:MAG: sulfide:quinone oxidoreductase [Thermoleophilaceae bacterium]|jgi:sulfide:quinone oxidoreductase|nr:sulfide:quinone oxidoreductase [Thermoleophilaceae bacterium]